MGRTVPSYRLAVDKLQAVINYVVILNFRHLHFLHSDRGFVGTIRKWCSLRCPQTHLSNWLKDTLFSVASY